MRRKKNIIAASALSAMLIFALSTTGNAETILINEPFVSVEDIDSDWYELSDPNTLHTFTNGEDRITVVRYEDYEDLPALARPGEQYPAVYQTFLSWGKEIYAATGYATDKENIPDIIKILSAVADPESDNGYDDTDDGYDSGYGYDSDQSASTSDESDTEDSSGGQSENPSDENSSDSQEPSASENPKPTPDPAKPANPDADPASEINDPYDLASWDPGTNSYIPFQKAGGDGAPIGRGEGWYYYDSEDGTYKPW